MHPASNSQPTHPTLPPTPGLGVVAVMCFWRLCLGVGIGGEELTCFHCICIYRCHSRSCAYCFQPPLPAAAARPPATTAATAADPQAMRDDGEQAPSLFPSAHLQVTIP